VQHLGHQRRRQAVAQRPAHDLPAEQGHDHSRITPACIRRRIRMTRVMKCCAPKMPMSGTTRRITTSICSTFRDPGGHIADPFFIGRVGGEILVQHVRSRLLARGPLRRRGLERLCRATLDVQAVHRFHNRVTTG
jgi:hypothetical protein